MRVNRVLLVQKLDGALLFFNVHLQLVRDSAPENAQQKDVFHGNYPARAKRTPLRRNGRDIAVSNIKNGVRLWGR